MQIQERLSMWGTFKKIFFGPKGPDAKIQPLLYQDGLLAFRASEQLKFGTHKVLAPSRLGEIEVRLDILSYDENEDMYRAQLADEAFTLDALRLERRGEFRLPKSIRVASSRLRRPHGRPLSRWRPTHHQRQGHSGRLRHHHLLLQPRHDSRSQSALRIPLVRAQKGKQVSLRGAFLVHRKIGTGCHKTLYPKPGGHGRNLSLRTPTLPVWSFKG